MVTIVPAAPEDGYTLVMPGVTVKFHALLSTLKTLTVTGQSPSVIEFGTTATILVALQLVGITVNTPTVIQLGPIVAWKWVPVIVSTVPAGPDVGDRPVMVGGREVT